MKKLLFITILLFLISCKKSDTETPKGLNVFYIILDKSSNSYSALGGEEENYINVDSLYISKLIDKMYYQININKSKNDLVLFFNYIDKDAKGNKELFFKIQGFENIDTTYHSKMGEVISSKKKFKETLTQKKVQREQEKQLFKQQKNKLMLSLLPILDKSKFSQGSDCSGALIRADNKLQDYIVDKGKYTIKNKIIIAFSDLVNFPNNEKKISIRHKIIRPGYSSEVTYLEDSSCVNITTDDEFKDLLMNLLNN